MQNKPVMRQDPTGMLDAGIMEGGFGQCPGYEPVVIEGKGREPHHFVFLKDMERTEKLAVDPLANKKLHESSYRHINSNLLIYNDSDGKDGVLIVDDTEQILTIHAEYFVNLDKKAQDGFSLKDFQNLKGLNNILNCQEYRVTDRNSKYYGYTVKFDLTFRPTNSENVAKNAAFNPSTETVFKGIRIGNSLIGVSNKRFNARKEVIQVAKAHNASVKDVKGMTTADDQHIIMREASTGNNLHVLHEIFHTLYFDNDGAETGIGSGRSLPNESDINDLIHQMLEKNKNVSK